MVLYKTAAKEATAEYVVERSRFIAHLRPVSSKEEADEFIARIRKEYKDATHNVPAMVIGDKMQLQWASDDGEPQGTSGAPMVQFMVGREITNVVIVVTRYFGGIKLGTGGLVRAYTNSAKLVLEKAGVREVEERALLKLELDYPTYSQLERMTHGGTCQIEKCDFADTVTAEVSVKTEEKERLLKELTNISRGSCNILSESIKIS
jgi:uncharacterized YigZ family protein